MTNNQWECQQWSQSDTDEFVAKLMVGPIVGIVLGLIMVILTALPLCCGVMKAQGKIIAIVGIIVGLIAILIPMLLSMGACGTFIDNICDNCKTQGGESSCDVKNDYQVQTTRQALEDSCAALGFLLVYLAAYGWAAVILGVVAMSLSCCILCGCCKMKDETTFQDNNTTSA